MTKTEILLIPELLRKRQYSLIIDEIWHRVFSSSRFIGFQRDPQSPLVIPDVKLNLNIRPIQTSDYEKLLDFTHQTSRHDIKYMLVEKAWLMTGMKTCYVTETEDKTPCHLQWMIGPEENNRLSKFIGDSLPRISDKEVLLENAFTTEAYRRRGIEMWTVKQLLKKATARGAERVILFIRDTNTVTQKIVQRLGFVPYLEKMDRRFLFFRKINFQPISKES
jgi:hypothetical protein